MDNFEFEVKCSWQTNTSDGDLSKLVSLGDADDPAEMSTEYKGEIRHVIDENDTIQLTSDSDEPCTFKILITNSDWRVSKVSIVSEASIIELYGPHGEYLMTSRGGELCSKEEATIFYVQPDVNVSHELSIKFPGVEKSFWLYGIKLLVKKSESPQTSIFDYDHVDEMLKTSRLPLTDKALRAKQFLQKYSSWSSLGENLQKQADPKILLKMLESEYRPRLRPVEEAGRNVSQYIASFVQQAAGGEKPAEGSPADVRAYVDESVRQLEERMEVSLRLQLDALEKRQNEKLDAILQILANKC
ncbi:Hypothetical protein NTJ_14518 [Nesidiocoris tenuis]|uniref:Uncharacterized protein n=2 Tax=Nesidiocoris tenuis TaxID=355587 RepID=A0ABN7BEZ6_9HEMI|nr:Hypothetical protein NTJ_14518 [Nesidiocoris tenuis]